MSSNVKYFKQVIVFLTITVGFAWGPRAAELVMFESTMCEWCNMWDEEVGVVYAKTTQGKRAPLRRLDINEEWPKAYGEFRNVEYTPTFILVEDGQVIGRIIGYPGESFFWELLSQLLENLPNTQTHACEPGAWAVKVGGVTC